MKINANANANEKSILIELGHRIKQNRIALNITQAELAKRCGISLSTETRIESGIDNYIKILKGLNVLENLDVLIPEIQPDFKSLYEQKTLRQRVKPSKAKAWIKKVLGNRRIKICSNRIRTIADFNSIVIIYAALTSLHDIDII